MGPELGNIPQFEVATDESVIIEDVETQNNADCRSTIPLEVEPPIGLIGNRQGSKLEVSSRISGGPGFEGASPPDGRSVQMCVC